MRSLTRSLFRCSAQDPRESDDEGSAGVVQLLRARVSGRDGDEGNLGHERFTHVAARAMPYDEARSPC